ncbi:TonB-dependent receptor [Sphingomonas sp. H39-1-10]|uniref:TonB-dependent receptor n=1 Tax=Sphingomonas pollutisoli TaxID=3030829 RepID=UPI0023B94666|nr:TonB-dependent receptor [Sphingomonas pollutisoli]MDF0491414.1 TonB-dependent receptor [Sphingomonas pollutisoli]
MTIALPWNSAAVGQQATSPGEQSQADSAPQQQGDASMLDAGTTAGDRLPKTPHWKVNISPRYTIDLDNGGQLIANVDYTYTSALFNNTENTPELRRDPVHLVNPSIIYRAPGNRWSLTAGGNNVANQRYLTTGQFQPGGGLIYGTYSRPAEWNAKLGVTF